MIDFQELRIHGDNIVECERALDLVTQALEERLIASTLVTGSVVCPKYVLALENPEQSIDVVFFPGFGRWDHDILTTVREMGGVLYVQDCDGVLLKIAPLLSA